MFKWPKTLDVAGYKKLKVFYLDRRAFNKRFPADGANKMGRARMHQGHVFICTEYPEDYWQKEPPQNPTSTDTMVTLLHEFLHHVSECYLVPLNETEVEAMAKELTKFIAACGIKFPTLETK